MTTETSLTGARPLRRPAALENGDRIVGVESGQPGDSRGVRRGYGCACVAERRPRSHARAEQLGQHAASVAERPQVRLPRAALRLEARNLGNAEAGPQRVRDDLGLDLEAARVQAKALDGAVAERHVAV